MLQVISETKSYQTQPILNPESIITYGEFKGVKAIDLKNQNYTSFKRFINQYEGEVSKELLIK